MEKICIGKNIKELRMKLGYTQEQLANELGVTRQTLSNWECEKTIPDSMQLNEISKRLNISIECIMGEEQKGKIIKMKGKTKKIWIILLSINIILTVITIIVAANQNDNILQKILIPVGPPVICSVIIWFVLQNALNSEDYSLIGGYNEKYNYNIKELRNIISFIQGYTVVVSLIANFVLFIFSFFPEYKSDYIYILYIYLVNLFVGIIYINIKKKNVLYVSKN